MDYYIFNEKVNIYLFIPKNTNASNALYKSSQKILKKLLLKKSTINTKQRERENTVARKRLMIKKLCRLVSLSHDMICKL